MNGPGREPLDAAELRARAETQLKREKLAGGGSHAKNGEARSTHELEVHQIELEMQNAELVRTREELEATLAKITDLYDFAPVGYLTLDQEGFILEANLAGASMLGVVRSELVNQRLRFFVAAADRPAFEDFLKRTLSSDSRQRCEVYLRREGPALRAVALEAVAAGAGHQCRVALTDVTERKHAEAALLASEVRYRRLFETAKDGILILDADAGVVVNANPFLLNLLGVERDEVLGKKIWDLEFFREIAASRDLFAALQRMETYRSDDKHLKTVDGRFLNVEFVSHTYRVDDARVMQCNLRDITERRQAEGLRNLTRDLLTILNGPEGLQESVQRVVAALKTGTGFDAVGIRLQEGEDFPYFAQKGFSKAFLRMENSLFARTADGTVCQGLDGKACLECTCGLVISGKVDPTNPHFTRGGSFWTSDSATLLDLPADQDPRLHPRNQCIHQGYAAVALVPIRDLERIVGLIQFNDRRKGCFTLGTVEILEGMAGLLGAALMRKRADKALEESEGRYRSLFMESRDAVMVLSPDGEFISGNPATISMFACRDALEFTAQSPESLSPPRQPDGKLSAPQAREMIQVALEQGSHFFEWTHRRMDGTVFPATVLLSRIGQDDRHLLQATVRDITEQKQTEAALRESGRLLRDSQSVAHIGAYVTNLQATEFTANSWQATPEIHKIFGIDETYPHTLAGWVGFIHPDSKAELLAYHQRVVAERRRFDHEYKIIRINDGAERWVHGTGELEYDDQPNPVRMLGTIQDITERKHAETALRESLHEKVALLKEVHHRVKNNLQVITSLLRLQAGQHGNPTTREVLEDMQGRIRSMAVLHETLYRSGNLARVDLSAYLETICNQLLRTTGRPAGSKIQLQFALSPLQIEADQALPCGLLVNELVSNCFKHAFSDGRSGEVRVSLHPLSEGLQHRLTVADNGVGLPAGFDVAKLKSLGLHLASDLSEQLGGALEIGPGPGAMFAVTFIPKPVRDLQ